MPSTRALVYARRSKDARDSLSIEDQISQATTHAERQGWSVAGVFTDPDVSAYRKPPRLRKGWRALVAELRAGDVVIARDQDRLVRGVPDWAEVIEDVHGAGARLATAVSGDIDTTSADGEFLGTLHASLGRRESRKTSERIRSNRRRTIEDHGWAFGPVPYGWRLVPAPGVQTRRDGSVPKVAAQDPDRIDFVRGMVERCQQELPTYRIVAWLDEVGAPLPTDREGTWTYSTVARLVRNPILAGLTPTNFGYEATAGERGPEILRDEAGEPVINEDIAIMSVADWRAMVAALDARTGGAHTPRASRRSTSPLLAGLVWCVACNRPMNRGRTAGREGFKCPDCYQTITRLEEVAVPEFLRVMGGEPRWRVVEEVHPDGGVVLELDRRIAELGQALVQARTAEESATTLAELQAATARRDERRNELAGQQPTLRLEPVDVFAQEWADADGDVDAQRAVLADALTRIEVRRGGVGQHFPASIVGRLRYVWRKPDPSAAYPPDSTTHGQALATDDERYGL